MSIHPELVALIDTFNAGTSRACASYRTRFIPRARPCHPCRRGLHNSCNEAEYGRADICPCSNDGHLETT